MEPYIMCSHPLHLLQHFSAQICLLSANVLVFFLKHCAQLFSHVWNLMEIIWCHPILVVCTSVDLQTLRVHKHLCLSLTFSQSHTLTVWVSPHLEQIKALSCLQVYPEVSEGWCWELVLLWVRGSWRRNKMKPYISRCFRVEQILLVCNSFLDSFLHPYGDALIVLSLPSVA